MKAILVIDIPDDFDTKTAIAIVDVKNEKGEGVTAMRPLMPVPLKRKSVIEWLPPNGNYKIVATHELTEYDKGWNDCVEFIELGGENND